MADKCFTTKLYPTPVDSFSLLRPYQVEFPPFTLNSSVLEEPKTLSRVSQVSGSGRDKESWEKRKGTDSDSWRSTWGLEYGANKLGMDKPQDGVEGPNPTEVDILELVAHFSQQLQAFFIILDLEMEKVEVHPERVP